MTVPEASTAGAVLRVDGGVGWIRFESWSRRSPDRPPGAEMIPVVTVPVYVPSGEPIAIAADDAEVADRPIGADGGRRLDADDREVGRVDAIDGHGNRGVLSSPQARRNRAALGQDHGRFVRIQAERRDQADRARLRNRAAEDIRADALDDDPDHRRTDVGRRVHDGRRVLDRDGTAAGRDGWLLRHAAWRIQRPRALEHENGAAGGEHGGERGGRDDRQMGPLPHPTPDRVTGRSERGGLDCGRGGCGAGSSQAERAQSASSGGGE